MYRIFTTAGMFHDVYKQWNKQTNALHLRLLLHELNSA